MNGICLYFTCILIIIDTCTVAGELELNPDSSVSICQSSSSGFKWTSVCYSGWTITHAKLACKQNGMDFQGIRIQ